MNPSNLLNWMLGILLFEFVFQQFLNILNRRHWALEVPSEFKDVYDEENYKKAQRYDKANDTVSFYANLLNLIVMFTVLYYGYLGQLHQYIEINWSDNIYFSSMLFFGAVAVISSIISLPFSLFKTFVIEQRYGFNKMTPLTFVNDLIKGSFVGGLLGAALLSAFIWYYQSFPETFWIYAWISFTLFSVFMAMFYTDLIVPLFNKLKPLEDGELKDKIEAFAKQVNFPLTKIFVIDGSKRSSKANAYFSGLGKQKKIVLFDTLISEQTDEELLAVLAHEIGHYKKKHILWSFILSSVNMLIIFYLFSIFINTKELSIALGGIENELALNLLAFSFLFSPISMLTGIFMNIFSRKNEYEADAYAKENYDGKELISALKKLSVNNLSNLTPHPIYSFFHYSHPPLLKRIEAIKK